MIDQIVDIQLVPVFVPVIIDATGLSDYDIPYDAVDLCERQRLVIGDLAALALEDESCSEAFFLKRILVFTDLRYKFEQIVVFRVENILKCKE
jgi:hypothetical protein